MCEADGEVTTNVVRAGNEHRRPRGRQTIPGRGGLVVDADAVSLPGGRDILIAEDAVSGS